LRHVRNRVVGGLLLVLPILITIYVLWWCYVWLEKYVIEPLAAVVVWKATWKSGADVLPHWFVAYVAPVIAILLAVVLLYLADMLANSRLRRAVDWILLNVPVVSFVYSPVRRMFQSLEEPAGPQSPKRIVLIPFPHAGMKVPAFVTATCRDVETGKVILSVYVPTTPVPTSGYFLLVPEEEVVELNWTSEQTLQAIISAGLSSPRDVCYGRPAVVPPFPPLAVPTGGPVPQPNTTAGETPGRS
jgi:uncharacterized membrane protein